MSDEIIPANPATEEVVDIPDMNIEPGLEPIGEVPTGEAPVEPEGEPEAPHAEPDASPQSDKFKDRAAKFQTRYQNALAKLKQYMTPIELEQFKASAGMAQTPTAPIVSNPGESQASLYDMTPDEYWAKMQTMMEKATNNKLAELQSKQRMDSEFLSASQQLQEFVQDGEFTEAQINAVMQDVNSIPFDYGKPGVFAHKANIIMQKLMDSVKGDYVADQINQRGVEAAQKAKALASVSQPPSGSQPAVPDLSYQRQALKEMRGLRRRSSASLIDKK